MKFPFPVFFAVLLGFATVACRPAKVVVAAPDPNPIGQWEWSNNVLGSWRLEIKDDGTFRRAVTIPLVPNPVIMRGRWILNVLRPKPSWLESHGMAKKSEIDVEWLRTAGGGAASENIQWSAPAVLGLFYTLPRGSELPPGAVWTGAMLAESSELSAPSSSEMEIGERHELHTHTDTNTGENFLDLGGKMFRKASDASMAEAFPEADGGIQKSAGDKPGPARATDFLSIEAFSGVTLDLPAEWQASDPNAAEQRLISLPAMLRKPRAPTPNSVWRFAPPGEVPDVYILVSVQANLFSAKQLTDSSQIDLDRFAAGFVKGASHALETKGYFLSPGTTAERTTAGERPAIACLGETVDPTGSKRVIRVLTIPTETATVTMACCYDGDPGTPWKALFERCYASLRVKDSFAASPPK